MSNVKGLEPRGPFVEGFIRFIWESDESGVNRQSGGFELLTHTHVSEEPVGQPVQLHTHPITDRLACRDSDRQEGRRHFDEVPIFFLGRTANDVLKAEYRSYDLDGDLTCKGDGCTAKRAGEAVKCHGPKACHWAKSDGCQLHVRMHAAVEGSDDPYAVFEFQSTSPNTYQALKAKLLMFEQIAGTLQGLPLRLTYWDKSTRGSEYKPFHCANIQLRAGQNLAEAKAEAVTRRADLGIESFSGYMLDEEEQQCGVDAVTIFKVEAKPIANQTETQLPGSMLQNIIAASRGIKEGAKIHTPVTTDDPGQRKQGTAVDEDVVI